MHTRLYERAQRQLDQVCNMCECVLVCKVIICTVIGFRAVATRCSTVLVHGWWCHAKIRFGMGWGFGMG